MKELERLSSKEQRLLNRLKRARNIRFRGGENPNINKVSYYAGVEDGINTALEYLGVTTEELEKRAKEWR